MWSFSLLLSPAPPAPPQPEGEITTTVYSISSDDLRAVLALMDAEQNWSFYLLAQ